MVWCYVWHALAMHNFQNVVSFFLLYINSVANQRLNVCRASSFYFPLSLCAPFCSLCHQTNSPSLPDFCGQCFQFCRYKMSLQIIQFNHARVVTLLFCLKYYEWLVIMKVMNSEHILIFGIGSLYANDMVNLRFARHPFLNQVHSPQVCPRSFPQT